MLMISVEARTTKLVASQPYSVLHNPHVVAEKTVGMAPLATHIGFQNASGFKTFKLVPIFST